MSKSAKVVLGPGAFLDLPLKCPPCFITLLAGW